MSNTSAQLLYRGAFIPAVNEDAQFREDTDVADCALDEQLEQLYRQYAAATRAVSRAKFEQELLESREDGEASVLAHAQRQRAAAETRCARLVRTIDALEERLEREEI